MKYKYYRYDNLRGIHWVVQNVHESHYEHTDYRLEAFVHKVKIGNYEDKVESDEGNDFTYKLKDTQQDFEKFDYSAYREEPEPKTKQPIDILDDVSFQVNRASLSNSPKEQETKFVPPLLETKEDLIKFHEDPQVDKPIPPKPDLRTLVEADFERLDDSEESTESNTEVLDYSNHTETPAKFDFSQYLVEPNN
jgi:hypothetical protein